MSLIEYTWGYLEETATNNCFFGSVERMQGAVEDACRALNVSPDSPTRHHFKTMDDLRQAA